MTATIKNDKEKNNTQHLINSIQFIREEKQLEGRRQNIDW